MSFTSEPPPTPTPAAPSDHGIRPMPFLLAAGWVFAATFVWGLLGALAHDFVGRFACQAAAYLFIVFAILRVHAPHASMRALLGVRRTHVAFYPLGILLGVAANFPANAALDLVLRRYPDKSAEATVLDLIANAGTGGRVLLGLIIVALGPLLEEVFFRGALFKPLERRYAASRSIAIGMTAVLFATVHMYWQGMIPLAMLGCALGFLRQASGSLVPSVLMHVTFNAVSFAALLSTQPGAADADAPTPLRLVALGSAATVLLLGLAYLVSTRTEAARHAQELDRQ